MKFQKKHPKEIKYPVMDVADLDVKGTGIVSACVGKDHGMKNPYNEETLAHYHEELKEVERLVESGIYPHEFMREHFPWDQKYYPEKEMPEILANFGLSYDDPKGCAEFVHMDDTIDLALAQKKWLMSYGYTEDKKAFEHIFDFIGNVPSANRKIAAYQERCMKKAFEIKWFYGVCRPEEFQGEGVGLTSYPEGCPPHPEFPQGHSTSSGSGTKANIRIYRPNKEHEMVLKVTAYLIGAWREFSRVHYAPSISAGLEVGGLLPRGYTNKRYEV